VTTSTNLTREAWLESAIDEFRPIFKAAGFPLPDAVHVSVGFSYGARAESSKVLGSTWMRAASEDGVNHVFISPEISDVDETHCGADALETLLHELVHVADDVRDGHRGRFIEIATAIGLTKPWTYSPPGPGLQAELVVIAASLGTYAHGRLTPKRQVTTVNAAGETIVTKLSSGPAKQTTRMVKIQCPACGYSARTSHRWITVGLPTCPCGTPMIQS